jgi:hypothetical protein
VRDPPPPHRQSAVQASSAARGSLLVTFTARDLGAETLEGHFFEPAATASHGFQQGWAEPRHVVLADFAESSDSSPASQATPFCEALRKLCISVSVRV